jgi:hypothetical protein
MCGTIAPYIFLIWHFMVTRAASPLREFHISKHLPDTFSIQNGAKQGGDLSLILNSELAHPIKKVKRKRVDRK